ncbi:hypothetical protein K440DRAFT_641129 [Wilcoxina mikolae CBS 423.85]|nr:hypothetical protein K440DRAFT_641129 [Wilcoxina mikolae CBS 423.85]
MSSDPVRLNEWNYRQWAVEVEVSLAANGYWKYVTGEMRVPRPPIVPASTSASISESASTLEPRKIVRRNPRDLDHDLEPESDDPNDLGRFKAFNRDWTTWEMNNSKAQGQIIKSIDTALQAEYRSIKKPKGLWDKIKADFQGIIKLDSKSERKKLATCRLESYSSVSEWIAVQEAIIQDIATCDISLDDGWRAFYITSNLPKTEKSSNYLSSVELNGKAEKATDIIPYLLAFEARLCRN